MFPRSPSPRSLAVLLAGALASSMNLPVAAADAAGGSQELQEVVITGSRILRPNLDSPVPVSTVTAEEIFSTGNTSIGDKLNDLPSLRSTIGQASSSRTLGTAGLNLLDLRGLGTERTLVLVNGRRHVAADILRNGVSPDVNTFPNDLIERIDVVTGGSSAVYGSDAIAGVVNFVLKRNFEGLQIRSQAGQTKYDDGGTYFLSGVAGRNFADGRGNIAANLEVASQSPIVGASRPNIASVNGFVVTQADPAGSVNGSDGIPDRTFFNDIRFVTIASGGLLQFSPAAGFAPCGRDITNTAFRCTYIFQQDGSLIPETGTRVGLAPNGNFIGGNGSTGRERDNFFLYPKLNRIALNVIGHYTVNDALEPFIEAKYVQTNSVRYGAFPFSQGTQFGGGDVRESPRFDNPFLSDSARTTINAARAAAGLAALTATSRLTLLKNYADLGGRQEKAKRETARLVVGLSGKFGGSWRYEASLNAGRFKEGTLLIGNVDKQRYLLAIDSVRDSSGNIVCRSKIDPAAATIAPNTNNDAYARSLLAADVAACVPLNPFGEYNITDAMRNYLLVPTTSIGEIKQFDATAFVTGNSSRWFSLPAGPIGIALGSEYRTERNYFKEEDLVANGVTFYNALATLDPPNLRVTELFAELSVPLLRDVPGFRDLSVTGAGRRSRYNGNTGTVSAYNTNLNWTLVDDLRIRAGRARAVRAPNLAELYSLQSQNFATNFVDPCAARNIATGSVTRAANCRAAGIPAAFDYVYTSSLQIVSGGNPNLGAETSDSLTLGAVISPRWVPGLSITADLYDIKVKNVITAPTAQQIANACYDAADLNNNFCSLFKRVGAGATGPRGEESFRILEGSLLQSSVNYAKLDARGIDTEIAYSHKLFGLGNLASKLVWTHTTQRNEYLNTADPGRADQVLGELGDPADAYNLSMDFTRGRLTVGWELRYIGKMVYNQWEDFFQVQGRPPQNSDYSARQFFPDVYYQNLRVGYDFSKSVNVYGGIDNLTNRQPPPPILLTSVNSTAIYDTRGRFMYVGVKATLNGGQ